MANDEAQVEDSKKKGKRKAGGVTKKKSINTTSGAKRKAEDTKAAPAKKTLLTSFMAKDTNLVTPAEKDAVSKPKTARGQKKVVEDDEDDFMIDGDDMDIAPTGGARRASSRRTATKSRYVESEDDNEGEGDEDHAYEEDILSGDEVMEVGDDDDDY